MNLKKLSFLIIIIGFFGQSFGQVGIFPTQTKWKRLKTETFDVITPSNQIYVGYKIMQYLHQFQREDSLLGHYKDKRTYIIYGDHAISNGFVGPGPYRSGLYLTPPQSNFIGPGNWVKNLVNHENHHFIQHADSRKGLLKFSYTVLGDFADSFLSNVYLMGWFWEGDAVFRESYANTYGRGNYSHFLNRNRLFAKQTLKYSKTRFSYAYNRPYNAYIPNHYNLGYEMVNYLSKTNANALYTAMDETVGRLTRLPKQIKKQTGKSLFQHYELALDSVAKMDSKMDYLMPETILKPTQDYLHQSSITNAQLEQSFYIEYSFLKPAKVYQDHKPLFTLGAVPDGMHRIQSNAHYIVWNELRTHPNFSTLSYCEIMVWDINKKKKTQLTKQSKSYSPTIHPKNNTLAYLELNSKYQFSIKEINITTGESRVLLNTESDYLRNLNYSENGEYITFIDQKVDQQILCVLNLKTLEVESFGLTQLNQISNAFLTTDFTFVLTADYNKYEYIYLYNPKMNMFRRSVKVTPAFKHMLVKDKVMTFDYQTNDGIRSGKIDLNRIDFTNLSSPRSYIKPLPTHSDSVNVDEVSYRGGIPRLRFHSVIPFVSTQDVQIDLYANDYLRKNNFLYRYYQNFGSENSVHQAVYTYAHFPVHLSGIFTHSSSGTRNMEVDKYFVSSFQENKYAVQMSYPISVLKSGYSLQSIPSVQWAHRTIDSEIIELNYGSKHSNIDAKNTFVFAKNRGGSALSSPLYISLNNRYATDFKKSYISENSLRFGFNLLNHEHFLEAELGLIKENTDKNLYRYRQEIVTPSTGYFLTTSSLGLKDESIGVFLSNFSTHLKVKMKNTIAYPNVKFTDFIFLKRIHIEPFVEQSFYRFRTSGDQRLTSYGSHIAFDIQWVKSLPVQIRFTYAKTPDLKSNSSFIGFGLVF